MHKKWISLNSVEIFCSHSAEKFRGLLFNVSGNLGYRKILCIIGGITFFHRNFFVSQYQIFCWGTLWCIRNFRLSKNFMHQRGASIKFVRRKHFVTQYRKCSLGNTSVYQKASGIENFYASERGGGGNTFSVKNFCHTVPKSSVGEHFGVSENFVYRKILCIRSGYH